MRGRQLLFLSIFASLLFACGGAASSPSSPASQGGDPSGVVPSLDIPDPGDSIVPGGGPTGEKGKVDLQITGDEQFNGTMNFLDTVSLFQDTGTYLVFMGENDQHVLYMTINPNENDDLVQYVKDNVGISGACNVTLSERTATVAKGSFECSDMIVIREATTGAAAMSGTFEARK